LIIVAEVLLHESECFSLDCFQANDAQLSTMVAEQVIISFLID
jgi:hypothetical protein